MHNQHRSPDPTKIERATATSTVTLFIYFSSKQKEGKINGDLEGCRLGQKPAPDESGMGYMLEPNLKWGPLLSGTLENFPH